MPDALGLVVLALEMFLTVRLARDHEILSWIWILVYVVLAIVGIYAWHDKKAPQTPAGWLLFAVGTVILGAVFFASDIGAGHSEHPNLPLVHAAKQVGSPLGFGPTLIVSPGLTIISIAGVVRAYYLGKRISET
jgi:thiol:disulfide interchange protein